MKIEQLKKSLLEMTEDEQLKIHQGIQESRLTIKVKKVKKKKEKVVKQKKQESLFDFSQMSVEEMELMLKQLEEFKK